MKVANYYENASEKYAFRSWLYSEEESVDAELHKQNSIKIAIRDELTAKQRYCFYKYFMEGQTMYEIADELNVNVSTVSRTLTSARKRLARVMRYSYPYLLNKSQTIYNRRK